MSKTIKAIFIPPACDPQWIEVPAQERAHYETVRGLVGGIIDTVGFGDYPQDERLRVYAVVNDEGLLVGLPPNLRTPDGKLLVGNVVITAERVMSDGDSRQDDLPDDAMDFVRRWIAQCERPGRFEYDVPPAQVLTGDDLRKAINGDIPPSRPVGIVGFLSDEGQFVGTRRT